MRPGDLIASVLPTPRRPAADVAVALSLAVPLAALALLLRVAVAVLLLGRRWAATPVAVGGGLLVPAVQTTSRTDLLCALALAATAVAPGPDVWLGEHGLAPGSTSP